MIAKQGYLYHHEGGLRGALLGRFGKHTKKYGVIRDGSFFLYKSDDTSANPVNIFFLSEANQITRSEAADYALEIIFKSYDTGKTSSTIISFKTEQDFFDWQEALEQNSSQIAQAAPQDFKQITHVEFDKDTGNFKDLPPEWAQLLGASKLTQEDVESNPDVRDVLACGLVSNRLGRLSWEH